MEVNGQLHALNVLHPAHIEYETGLTPQLEWHFVQEIISCVYWKLNHDTSVAQPIA